VKFRTTMSRVSCPFELIFVTRVLANSKIKFSIFSGMWEIDLINFYTQKGEEIEKMNLADLWRYEWEVFQ